MQTWTYSSGVWTRINLSKEPAPRDFEVLVYDSSDHYLLLYGGYSFDQPGTGCTVPGGHRLCNDTWEFSNGRWHELASSNASPLVSDPYAVYDSKLGAVLMGGGTYNNGRLTAQDPWWTYRSGSWTRLTLANNSTNPLLTTRVGALIFDAKDHSPIFVGTVCAPCTAWTWQLTNLSWIRLTTSGAVNLSYNWQSEAQYDPGIGAIVLFGAGTSYDQTWALVSHHWKSIPSGPTLSGAFLIDKDNAFNTASSQLVLYDSGQTWVLK
jgi:hypothetical protein